MHRAPPMCGLLDPQTSSLLRKNAGAPELLDVELRVDEEIGPANWGATVTSLLWLARGTVVAVRVPADDERVFRKHRRVRILGARVKVADDDGIDVDEPGAVLIVMTPATEVFGVPE